MIENDGSAWNAKVQQYAGAHILQSWQWGQVKEKYGWQPNRQIWETKGQESALGLILKRKQRFNRLSPQFSIYYVPRGPICDWSDSRTITTILNHLEGLAGQKGTIFIKIDPEVITGRGVPGSNEDTRDQVGQKIISTLTNRKWFFSESQIQFRNTTLLDLHGTEDDWLSRMKQKTRYNLRLAQKKDVQIRLAADEDLPHLYRLYAETSLRDRFVIRSEDYYLTIWRTFMEANMAKGLIAEVDANPVAGLFLFTMGKKAWYLYGMSTNVHREKMPNYLLQWEAMKYAKEAGCEIYDLWGAPDQFIESDSMWGVYRFKEGLGGKVIRTIGAWDFTLQPNVYRLYTRILPKVLDLMRRRGRKQTEQSLG
jgi:lipid II:glycine glycyltransferase (peptidoglycan interpeptide bridge formation enzyme)